MGRMVDIDKYSEAWQVRRAGYDDQSGAMMEQFDIYSISYRTRRMHKVVGFDHSSTIPE